MSESKRLAHAIWECKCHIVWCRKYRFRIFRGVIKKSVEEILQHLCGWKNLEIPELKNRYWGRHFWVKGYCVSSVGLDEEKIPKYVK